MTDRNGSLAHRLEEAALKINPWIRWESVDGDDCGAPLDHLLEHEGGWPQVLTHYEEVRHFVTQLAEVIATELDQWVEEFALIAEDGGESGLRWCSEELAAEALRFRRGDGQRALTLVSVKTRRTER